MKITATIMAHPMRQMQANQLANELLRYPFSHVSITWDRCNNEWDTGSRSLQCGIGEGDWHLVIQDDAVLTPSFYDNLVGAISSVPERVLISLYTGTVRPMAEEVTLAVQKAEGATWLKHHMLLWGVGILMPSDHIEPMLDFLDDPMFYDTLYDIRIGMFYQRNRLPVYYTMPSLVNHNDSNGSIIGTTAKEPRVAHRVATGLVAWNQDVIHF